MDWIGSCGLGTGNGFSLGDDNSRLIHQHISQSNRKTIFSTPTITPIFRAFLETVMKRLAMAALLNILLPSSSISTSTGLNMRNFFLLLFHSASIAPDRREIKATKLLTVERPTSHKERGATVYLFFLFSFCAITNQTEKREERKSHLETTHGLISWMDLVYSCRLFSLPSQSVVCWSNNTLQWSALIKTYSAPANAIRAGCFFFLPTPVAVLFQA